MEEKQNKDIYKERKEQFMKLCDSLAEQFYKKNKDYGDSYFKNQEFSFEIDKKLSKVDFYCQIRRKFGRIANFYFKKLEGIKADNLVNDETEEDTIRDLAIYCVMELIKRGDKKNPKVMDEADMIEKVLKGEKK